MTKLQTRAILSLRSLQWDDKDIAIVLGIAVSDDAPQKPILGPLSEDELRRRLPQKPEELVDALNDPIHREVGRSRPGRTAKRQKKTASVQAAQEPLIAGLTF